MRPYPEYRDSGVEWLGRVPAGWEVVPLKTVATCNDEVLSEGTDPLAALEYIEISGVDAYGGVVETTETTFGAAPSRARRIVRDGDVLISTVRTYLRAIAQIADPVPGLIASTGFAVLRPKSVLSSYLGHVCRSEYFIGEIISRSVGVSYPAISASQIMALAIPLPPLPEQQSIASFLYRETAKIDGLIEESRRLIALLAEKRQATISHAVTRGLNPSARLKPSGVDWLGDIPEGWEVGKVRYLAHFVGGGTPSREKPEFWGGKIPWVSPKDMKARRVVSSEEMITEAGLANSAANLITVGSVLIVVRSGILKHTIPVAITEAPVAINQDIRAITFDPALMTAGYFAYFVEGYNDALLLVWGKQGATVESIEHQYVIESRLPIPPVSQQHEISVFLDAETARLDKLTEEAEAAIALLSERRAALISAAVTGKIDVRDTARAA